MSEGTIQSHQRCGACGKQLPHSNFQVGESCPHCDAVFGGREVETITIQQGPGVTPADDPRLTAGERMGWVFFVALVAAAIGTYWLVRDTPWFARHFGDVPERTAAAQRLAAGGPEGIPNLLELMNDVDPEVRAAAIRGITALADQPGEHHNVILTSLGNALQDADEGVRLAATRGLGALAPAPEAVTLLRAQLDSRIEGDKATAAAELGRFGSAATPAVPALVASAVRLGPKASLTAQAARGSLEQLGDAAIPGLVGCTDHPSGAVRRFAITRLAGYSPRPPAVREALERAMESPHKDVRAAAARALIAAEAPTTEQIVALIKLLDEPGTRRDADAGLARAAELPHALADISAVDARAAVPRLLQYGEADQGDRRQVAVRLLDAMGPEAVAPLADALNHSNPVVRQRALNALRAHGSAAAPALDAVKGLLDDSDLAQPAFDLLASMGPPASRALIDASHSRKHDRRVMAVHALGKAGHASAPVIAALGDALDGRRDQADAAIGALKALGAGGVMGLARALGHSHRYVRRQAARALVDSSVDISPALPSLIRASRKRDRVQRRAVTAALARHASRTSVAKVLERLSSDRDKVVRETAKAALAQ